MVAEKVTPKAKGKLAPKLPKPSKTQLAFREYERVSYYLATQGDFNFAMDDEAREMLWFGDDMSADINLLTMNRISPDEDHDGRKIPAGDHIDGLAIRTDEREKKHEKAKKTNKAALKSLGVNVREES